jgi:prepilin signal peptidase PulO-like enzyme (type II secretory pathway)
MLFYLIFFFIFGAIVGSFLNVVSLRLNTGKGIVSTRSACFSCAKTLKWYELVPIFSFIALQGKCSKCRSRISIQYILVEIATGLIFALISYYFPYPPQMFFYFAIFSILIVIFVYDLRHMIIPDVLSYSFAVLAFMKLLYELGFNLFSIENIYVLLAGPIVALPFALLWLISNGRWIGFGDAKLALGIGWLLGISLGFTAVIFSFWIGALISILLILMKNIFKNKLSMKSEVPFGPYLIIGLTIVFFSRYNLFDLVLI